MKKNIHSPEIYGSKGYNRREFLKMGTLSLAGISVLNSSLSGAMAGRSDFRIKDIVIDEGVSIETENGTTGTFRGSSHQDFSAIQAQLPKIKELLIGKDPLDRSINSELIWETMYPGKAKLFEQGIDPLTEEIIAGKPRGQRHTPTGKVFMAFSTIDNALWDLRGELINMPVYKIIGDADRQKVPVYWRPGEAKEGLDEACKRAKDAFDQGYTYQKWYWNKGAKDGGAGLRENIELVRRLREAVPDLHLMIDNHSIRYDDDVEYSVILCKAVAQYNPFWIEEPICPEHVEGYRRIKEETGVTIAGGEHLYTRWAVKPFLEQGCIDYVQSDPIWCGGISEWLKICEMTEKFPGVKVVPHITSPWVIAPHCVASQPEKLCPLLEYNVEGGKDALIKNMERSDEGLMVMRMPQGSGI